MPGAIPLPARRAFAHGVAVCAGLGALLSLWLVWGTDWPLGVPGEWVWPRLSWASESVAAWAWALVPVLLVGALYVAVCVVGGVSVGRVSGWVRGGWLAGLCMAGFLWLLAVQAAAPTPLGLGKVPWVLFYRRSSGYFSEARDRNRSVAQYLAEYEGLMRQGDVLHIGTHPPGLFLVYRGLLAACDASSSLRRAALATEPPSVREAFAVIDQTERLSGRWLGDEEQAALWLAFLITQAVAVSTVVPAYLLMRQDHDATTAWQAVAFWPLVPALAVFLPKSDALYPFLGMTSVWLWRASLSKRSLAAALAAGLSFWLGLLLSLAMLPIALLAFVATGWQIAGAEQGQRRTAWKTALGAATIAGSAFVLATVVFSVLGHIRLPAVWWLNYTNHAAFYEHFPRTYRRWLPINVIEFAVAAGTPLAVAALAGLACGAAGRSSRSRPALAVPIGFAVTWTCLWLSGKNMGEAARLWIVLMPWLLPCAALLFAAWSPHGDAGRTGRWLWVVLLLLQAVVCTGLTLRIDGFHLTEMMGGHS